MTDTETPEQRKRRHEAQALVVRELLPLLPKPRAVGLAKEPALIDKISNVTPHKRTLEATAVGAVRNQDSIPALIFDVAILTAFNLQPYIRVTLTPRTPSGVNAEFTLDPAEDPSQPGQYADPLPCTVEVSLTRPKSEHTITLRVLPGEKTLPRETLALRRYSAGEENRWDVSISVFEGGTSEDGSGG